MTAKPRRIGISLGKPDMRPRGFRLNFDRCFEMIDGSLRFGGREMVDRLDPAQQRIIGVEPLSGFPRPRNLGGSHLSRQCPDDPLGDVVLDGKQIFQVAVVAFGPDMAAGLRFDELGRDPDAIAALRTLPSTT